MAAIEYFKLANSVNTKPYKVLKSAKELSLKFARLLTIYAAVLWNICTGDFNDR